MYQNAEIVHWFKNKDTHKIIPAHADIDLTNICNQDCFYCNSADFRKEKPVQKKYTDYINLIDKLSSWRSHSPKSYGTLHSLSFPGGGEPTILNGYEKVLEYSLDQGFLVSITTNGSKLDRLIENVHVDKIRKITWVGIDIDAGNEDMYEQIRRSLTKESLFTKVISNAHELVKIGANVDFKVLLNHKNSTRKELESIFETSKKVGIRMIYFRPTIINNTVFQFNEQVLADIRELSEQFNIVTKLNQNKTIERNYKKCHQMFQFPVFSADGKIYSCCENRGNERFSIGNWDVEDFRDIWCGDKHMQIYQNINTKLCQPCRPNKNNIEIQNIIDNPNLLENLYT